MLYTVAVSLNDCMRSKKKAPETSSFSASLTDVGSCLPEMGSLACKIARDRERCRSGRSGQTRNLLSPLRGTVGSNPTLSANRAWSSDRARPCRLPQSRSVQYVSASLHWIGASFDIPTEFDGKNLSLS